MCLRNSLLLPAVHGTGLPGLQLLLFGILHATTLAGYHLTTLARYHLTTRDHSAAGWLLLTKTSGSGHDFLSNSHPFWYFPAIMNALMKPVKDKRHLRWVDCVKTS